MLLTTWLKDMMGMDMSHTEWKIQIAQKVASVYTSQDNVKAVYVTGGIARDYGDRYSDIDLAVVWSSLPTDDDRRDGQERIADVLDTPITARGLLAWPVLDTSDTGMLLMDAVWIAGDESIGLKLDIYHSSLAGTERFIDSALVQHESKASKILYSMQHVLPLYGEDHITKWQERLTHYPDELAHNIIERHLFDIWAISHIDLALKRGHLHSYFEGVLKLRTLIMGILFALNHKFDPYDYDRPERYIDDLAIKPDNLIVRIDSLFTPSQDAVNEAINLAQEIYALVKDLIPDSSLSYIRERLNTRRAGFDESPIKI